MNNGKSSKQYMLNRNSGFSIVEVLVAVAIIAIVFTPLLKSFSTAAIVNSRAQKLQNVTSLAEGVMEDVKGKSIQELHDLAVSDASVTFSPLDEDGGLTLGKLTKIPPYELFYENVTATQGITYDAKVTISTSGPNNEYSDTTRYDERKSNGSTDAGDISDVNIRELPVINQVDSHSNAVISWEINQYDKKAMENLAAENTKTGGDIASLKGIYSSKAEKDINIKIKTDTDSGLTKIICDVEYKTGTGNTSDKTLKYLVYSGYFSEPAADEPGGPNIYLFYTLSENVKDVPAAESFKNENITISDETSGRHSIYFIMQDGQNSLNSTKGTKIKLDISGTNWSSGVSYNADPLIPDSTKYLAGESTESKLDDVIFCSNLLDQNSKVGELYNSSAKTRIYYVTVDIMEHGKTDVLATLTSTMQAGKEAN